MNNTIGILGCGWLGFPLAQHLSKQGFTIKGSTTSLNKLPLLKEQSIIPYLINLEAPQLEEALLNSFLEDCHTLIIAIPPRFKEASLPYNEQLTRLLPYLYKSAVNRIIFMSSTSVYGCQTSIITESTAPNPEMESGKLIVAAENLFCGESQWKTTILRLGGLFGPHRHPVTFLSKKSVFENPDLSINMVHLDDVIACTVLLLNQKQNDDCSIYNLVAPYHQTRKEFYGQAAQKMRLQLPPDTTTNWSLQKKVSSDLIIKKTGYKDWEQRS